VDIASYKALMRATIGRFLGHPSFYWILLFSFLSAITLKMSFHFEDLAAHEQRPHVHGESNFVIVKSNQELRIDWTVSGADTLGFERKPQTEAERQAFEAFRTRMNTTESLIQTPSRARCEFRSPPSIDLDEHGHGHMDLLVRWTMNCERPQSLRWIEIHASKAFPSLNRNRVALISDEGQTQELLGPNRQRARFP